MGKTTEGGLTKTNILRGIEGHADLQAEIGAAILASGNNLSERDFDRIFSRMDRPFDRRGICGDSFILTINGPQQEALQLAQMMMCAGLISAETRDGCVYYSIP